MTNPNTEITSNLLKDKVIFWSTISSLIFLFLSFILTLINFFNLPSEIPIFYSSKTNILANKIFIFLMPASILAVFLINLALCKFFLPKEKFLAQVLAITTSIFGFLVLFAQIEIVLLF